MASDKASESGGTYQKVTHRAPRDRDHPYSSHTNAIVTDHRLTYAQRLLLIWVLSKPDGWQTKEWNVEDEMQISRPTYYRAMRAFEAAGYLHRHTYLGQDGLQKYVHEWYEVPRVVAPTSRSDRVIKMSTREKVDQSGTLSRPGGETEESVIDHELVVNLGAHFDNPCGCSKRAPVSETVSPGPRSSSLENQTQRRDDESAGHYLGRLRGQPLDDL